MEFLKILINTEKMNSWNFEKFQVIKYFVECRLVNQVEFPCVSMKFHRIQKLFEDLLHTIINNDFFNYLRDSIFESIIKLDKNL